MQLGKIVTLALVAAACSHGELQPASSAPQENAGVRVFADPGAWRGDLAVQRELVPVELVIENRRAEPVYFSTVDVKLIGPERRLDALAPERVKIEQERVSLGLDPRTPEFLQYSAGQEYHPPFELGPTTQVRQAAIADGPIAPGGVRRGFVYFERLPKDLEQATLRVAFRAAQGDRLVAVVDVPFAVER